MKTKADKRMMGKLFRVLKGSLLILTGLFIFIGTANTQTVAVTGGTYDGQTLSFALFTGSNFPNLIDATEIKATGDWTETQLAGLRCALKNNTILTTFNSTLQKADLSEISPIGTFTSTGNYGFVALFIRCTALITVLLPSSAPSSQVGFSQIFFYCIALKEVDLSNVTMEINSFHSAFGGCSLLESVTLPAGSDVEVNMQSIFANCSVLKEVKGLEKFTKISNLSSAFQSCWSLESLTLPANGSLYTGGISFQNTFTTCHALKEIKNLEKFTNISNLGSTFSACFSLTSIFLGSISAATNNTFSFANPNMLKYLPKGASQLPTIWTTGVSAAQVPYYKNFIKGNTIADAPIAYDNIILVDKISVDNGWGAIISRIAPYYCPLAFTVKPGCKATYTRDFTNKFWDGVSTGKAWNTIILPFNATIPSKSADFCNGGDFGVYSYIRSNADQSLTLVESPNGITAHTPHLIVLKQSASTNGVVTFESAFGITIPATPADLTVTDPQGKHDYKGNFRDYPMKTYYLEKNLGGDVFKLTEISYSGTADNKIQNLVGTEQQPFRAFFLDNNGMSPIDDDLTLPDCPFCPAEIVWIGNGGAGAGATTETPDKNLWSVAANWIGNTLPKSIDRVVYQTNAIDLHVDGNYTVASITNATTADLVVLPNKSLILNGATDGNPTVNFTSSGKTTVKAENGTLVNGTFLVPAGTPVNANVEFRTKAQSTNVTDPDVMKWQYFGIPVASFPANTLTGAWVRKFDHTTTEGTSIIYWYWLTNESMMLPTIGYEISIPATHNGLFTFTGSLLTSDQTISIMHDADDYFAGQWVVSNPFTAGLNISTDVEFESENTFLEEIYLFNTGTSVEWDGKTGNTISGLPGAAGQYTVMAPLSSGGTIPSMQGFVVKLNRANVLDGSSANFKMKYPAAVQNGLLYSIAAPKVFTDIWLLSDEKLKDRMQVYIIAETTRGYDNGYDGHKMFGSAKLSQLFSEEEGEKYQINAVPELDGIFLSVKAQEGIRNYTLRFTHNNLDGIYESITLTDLHSGASLDISEGGEYNFTASNERTAEKRFVIRTNITGLTAHSIGGVEVYRRGDGWNIANQGNETQQISLYNVSGVEILRKELAVGAEIRINANDYLSGVYIVKVNGGTNKKIVL